MAGGVATILIFFVLSYWVTVNLFFSIYDNGSFVTDQATKVTQQSDGSFPVYEFSKEQLFIAYRLNSFDPKIEAEVDRYIQGIWVQVRPDRTMTHYHPVPCLDVFPDHVSV